MDRQYMDFFDRIVAAIALGVVVYTAMLLTFAHSTVDSINAKLDQVLEALERRE